MSLLYKSTASQVVMLKLFLSSDHVTAATGKTVAITISKNGGAFGNPNAGATNATEVSSGWYKVTLDATDTATEGDLVVRGTATSCDDAERVFRVHLPPNFGVASIDSNGRVDVIKVAGTTQTAGDIPALINTLDDYVDTEVAAIKTKTDQLTFTTANQVDATAITISTGALSAAALATDAVNEIADGILDRNMATGTDSGSTTVRTPRQALRAIRNKVAIATGTATIYKEDDATSSWTAAVTTTAGDPISAVDPAGP